MMRQTNFTFLIKYYTIFKVFIHKEDLCSFFPSVAVSRGNRVSRFLFSRSVSLIISNPVIIKGKEIVFLIRRIYGQSGI